MAIPAVAGTNCWTEAEDLMVTVLTQCASVLTFLGVGDASAALAGNMYLDSMGEDPEEFADAAWLAKFPAIIIGTPGNDAGGFLLTNRSTGADYGAQGTIELVFAQMMDTADDYGTQERKFKNSVGDMLIELTDKAMDMVDLTVQRYGRLPEDDQVRLGPMIGCWVHVPWGTESSEGGE